jgi:hypothetical protein
LPAWLEPHHFIFWSAAASRHILIVWVIWPVEMVWAQRPALRGGGVIGAAGATAAAGAAVPVAAVSLFLPQADSASSATAEIAIVRFILNPPARCPVWRGS